MHNLYIYNIFLFIYDHSFNEFSFSATANASSIETQTAVIEKKSDASVLPITPPQEVSKITQPANNVQFTSSQPPIQLNDTHNFPTGVSTLPQQQSSNLISTELKPPFSQSS